MTFPVTVTVTDAAEETATAEFPLTVHPAVRPEPPTLWLDRPDAEAIVWAAIRQLGGMSSWAFAAADESTPQAWLSTVSIQVDARAKSKEAAYHRADQARQIILRLPWSSWPGAIITTAAITDGPYWLPDDDGAPRYVARYEIQVHPASSALPANSHG